MMQRACFFQYLLSRGLYSFAFASVPVLLSVSAVQDGYDSSQIGLILGVGALPAVFGGLVAPVLLHRISQKKLFHITTMPWVFVALFCAGWSFIDTIALPGYMVISFMVELAGALLIPTMGSFLPQLVESKELERANSTQNFVLGICSAAGPAVVSFFMLLLNASAMWLVLAGCMCMSLVVQRSLPDLTPEQEEGGREGLLVDLRFFLRARTLVRVVTGSAVWHFVIWSLFMTQGPVLMRDLYDSSWAWGLVQSLFSVGSIIGSLIPIPIRWKTSKVCLLSLLPFCLVPVAMLLRMPLWVVCILISLASLAIAAASVRWAAAVQKSVPQRHIAGIFAFDYALSEGISPVGFIVMPLLSTSVMASHIIVGLVIFLLAVLSVGKDNTLDVDRNI